MTFGQEGVIYGGGNTPSGTGILLRSKQVHNTPARVHVHFNTLKCSENQGEIKRHMVDLGIKINIAD